MLSFQKIFQVGVGIAIAAVGLSPDRAIAQLSQQELDQNGVTLVASPYQNGEQHQLLILEQLTNAKACWSEQKTQTFTVINPLLLGFDFSGICGRATDSNGFSIRMGNRDFDWRYALQVVEKENDLILIARNTTQKKTLPDLLIGRVGANTTGFGKIILQPGWRVTRRIAEGKLTGHFYLTHDRTVEEVAAAMQGLPTPAANILTTAPTVMPIVSGSGPVAEPVVLQEAANVPPAPPKGR